MTPNEDHGILEVGRTTLKLRSDLVFTPQTTSGTVWYLVEDPVNSKYYRVGLPEYTFISLLDGQTTVSDAVGLTANALPEHELSEQDVTSICKWLVEADLAHTAASAHANRLVASAESAEKGKTGRRLNPIIVQLPLCHPDRFLRAIVPWVGWFYAAPAFAVWSVVMLAAAYRVAEQWDRFAASSEGILSPERWLWLGLCWLFLKVVHELSHGIVCKKYGGSVREAGVLLILFAPIAYVDVTSSWRFCSKWQRIHTAAAGIYIELSIASVAALIWSTTRPGLVNDLCFNLVIMASLMTVVFNANFLMRFDGYYVLADWLEIPNLYAIGQQYLRYFGRTYLLGIQSGLPCWPRGKGGFIRVYGFAAMIWRVAVCAGLVIAAAALFHGAGIVLAVLAGTLWLGLPAVRFGKFLICPGQFGRPNRLRFLSIVGSATVAGTLLLIKVPWWGAYRAPVIVEFSPLAVVRTGSPGMVRQICVRSGQFVKVGQVLAVLENEELELELADLEIAIQQSLLKGRSYQQKNEIAAYQAELDNVKGLEKQQDEKQAEVEQLTVRAPKGGKIIARNLDLLKDTYLEAGTEIVSMGDEACKELRISVAQEDIEVFTGHLQQPVRIRVPSTDVFQCPLVKVDPRASVQPPHHSLCAPNGGPLVVKRKAADENDSQTATETYELLTPRFVGVVSLSTAQSRSLRAGQRGTITFRTHRESIGSHLYTLSSRWVRRTIARSMGANT